MTASDNVISDMSNGAGPAAELMLDTIRFLSKRHPELLTHLEDGARRRGDHVGMSLIDEFRRPARGIAVAPVMAPRHRPRATAVLNHLADIGHFIHETAWGDLGQNLSPSEAFHAADNVIAALAGAGEAAEIAGQLRDDLAKLVDHANKSPQPAMLGAAREAAEQAERLRLRLSDLVRSEEPPSMAAGA